MTLSEAKKLAKIAAEVDSGCPDCVRGVVRDLNAQFPEFIWVYDNNATVEVLPIAELGKVECVPDGPTY